MRRARALGLALLLASGLAPAASGQRGRPATVPSPVEAALEAITPDLIRAHQHFLSDTLLQGAIPGSRGGALAARYVATQFEALGLKPAAADGSYFQAIPLVGVRAEPSVILGAGRQTIALDGPEEFVAWPETTDSVVTVDGDVVFAGYGIEAPEWGWDDYKGVPQRGRIVLVLVNDPGIRDSTIFNGRSPTPYGRWSYKLEAAAKMGALGVLLVHTEESAGLPWASLRDALSGEQLRLAPAPPRTARAKSLQFAAWVRGDVVRKILQTAGRDYDLLLRRAHQREFSPIAVGLHAAVDIRSQRRRLTALNVIAKLDGSEPVGAREAVVLSAAVGAGDSIRASATAALLAAAAGSARLSPARRSLLFLATAGAAGTDFYTSAPAFPLARTAAVVNLAAGRPSNRAELRARGSEYSSLGDTVVAAARAERLTLNNEREALYDSGAYSFAEVGVPTLEIVADGGRASARVLLRLAWALVTGAQRPSWLPGSPFGGERAK